MNGNTYRVAQNHENPQFLWKRRNVMFPKSIFHGDTVAHVDHLHLLLNQKIHLTISKVDTWIRGFPILLTLSTSSVLMLAYRQLRGGDRGGSYFRDWKWNEYLPCFCCCTYVIFYSPLFLIR